MNENKRKGIKKILLFLRCFRLEKCIQLPAAGKRKPSQLLPVIFAPTVIHLLQLLSDMEYS